MNIISYPVCTKKREKIFRSASREVHHIQRIFKGDSLVGSTILNKHYNLKIFFNQKFL